jgi:hypothetical protein
MSGGALGSPPDHPSMVRMMVERGYAVPIQAHPKGGYITYEFIGGTYDGVKMRLYPPFERRVTLWNETYVWGPPKNKRSARFTYRLEG